MQSKKVFLAEDVFLAFVDRAHTKHLHAGAFFRYFAQQQYFLYTNVQIVIATYQNISQNISSGLAKDFLKAFQFSTITILYPEEPDVKSAIKAVLTHTSSTLPLDEALMLVMAEKRGIGSICTFSYLHNLFGVETFYLPL